MHGFWWDYNFSVITPDGREVVEIRNADGTTSTLRVGVRPYGYVGDLKPDLQMCEVCPGVILSSQDVAADKSLMQSNGITHVLNVATGVDNLFPDDFQYLSIAILDLPNENIRSHFETCFAFMNSANKVLVHCNAGVSRSVTIVTAYLMKHYGLRLADAFEKVRSLRPAARPNPGFLEQLQAYDKELLECN